MASGHLYPEVPGALITLLGVRAVLSLPRGIWSGLVGIGVAATVLVVLKERYAPLALGLLLWAALWLARRRPGIAVLLLVGIAIVGAGLLTMAPVPGIIWQIPALRLANLWSWNHYVPRAAVGLLADQEFGLLFSAPAWVLAAVGAPLLWQRQRNANLGLLGLFVFYLVVVAKFHWIRWDADGGPRPPGSSSWRPRCSRPSSPQAWSDSAGPGWPR